MSKCRVEILTPAANDINQIAQYHLLSVGPSSAEKITDKLLDSIEGLSDYPLMGTEHPDPALRKRGYRKLVCGEYISVYRIIDDAVLIYRVVHDSTDYPRLFK
ncbi:MAG TPA: type II toxin-antitoxin system RelE/ParE family toxin [Anaerovoracaceae bacterium]|nr:type II toxin-antitoxin system RelE/ParE family toxin [Anaerovoracaceae bacterium]